MWASLSFLTILVASAYSAAGCCNFICIREKFEEYMIVPQFIRYPPIDPLSGIFGRYRANFGNNIPRCAVIQEPLITFPNPDNDALYTLFGLSLPTLEEIDNNGTECIVLMVVNFPGANIKDGDTIVPYRPGIAPPACGYRRALGLVYRQPKPFNVTTDELSSYQKETSEKECINFNLTAFVEGFKFGNPIAGNFFCLESECGRQCGDDCNNGCNNNCNCAS